MRILSPAFSDDQLIPEKYTCDGENVNPPFEFVDIPKDIVTLVLIADDSDSTPEGFTHWLVWNIAPSIGKIEEGGNPKGAMIGKNDFGNNKYEGPCSLHRSIHHYRFKLYGLDTRLEIIAHADKQMLEDAMEGHILVNSELLGQYGKK